MPAKPTASGSLTPVLSHLPSQDKEHEFEEKRRAFTASHTALEQELLRLKVQNRPKPAITTAAFCWLTDNPAGPLYSTLGIC